MKRAFFTACAGVPPKECLEVLIGVISAIALNRWVFVNPDPEFSESLLLAFAVVFVALPNLAATESSAFRLALHPAFRPRSIFRGLDA